MAQFLDIDLDSVRNLKSSLENSWRDMVTHYDMQDGVTWSQNWHRSGQSGSTGPKSMEVWLNIKVKWRAEITTHCCLLEVREDFNLDDTLGSNKLMQSI